jgi:hypothetical protein
MGHGMAPYFMTEAAYYAQFFGRKVLECREDVPRGCSAKISRHREQRHLETALFENRKRLSVKIMESVIKGNQQFFIGFISRIGQGRCLMQGNSVIPFSLQPVDDSGESFMRQG